jgi:murein DD-endopeptidase MepM/ murein hydrolase activator NlpD
VINTNNNGSKAVQLAIAAARAFYGDYTGIAVQGVKYIPQILGVVFLILFLIVIMPLFIAQSIFSKDSATTTTVAVEALKYGEEWIKIMSVAHVKNPSDSVNGLPEAAFAVSSNTIEDYIGSDSMELYNNNYELFNNTMGSYAGEVFGYDELPLSSSSISLIYNQSTRKNELLSNGSVFYNTHDVVNYKVSGNSVKIKYKQFALKAYFPISGEYAFNYSDSFGNDRFNNGKHVGHEGIDIFADRNTPEIAVEDCVIKKIGWNGLGGWRILMDSADGVRQYYYAHMENYAPSLQQYKDGKVHAVHINVSAGEVIGYVGSSGGFSNNTPPGTDTGTPPHIHFQMWVKNFSDELTLINPYNVLKLLESNKNKLLIENTFELEGL